MKTNESTTYMTTFPVYGFKNSVKCAFLHFFHALFVLYHLKYMLLCHFEFFKNFLPHEIFISLSRTFTGVASHACFLRGGLAIRGGGDSGLGTWGVGTRISVPGSRT